MSTADTPYDIFVIGGGVNGAAIARDAAGRRLRVALAEKGDLASETSSKSTKLFHGGLRYLEYFEIKLVRESLEEREVLLRNMPHIAWPMRFVLPLNAKMRFENTTPVGKLLGLTMPWRRGRRPDWVIRLGLWFYDHLGGRDILPSTATLDLKGASEGVPLKPIFQKAFEYSDVWVQDARLVVLLARDAKARGANIMTRSAVTKAERADGLWRIHTEAGVYAARMLVNAAGPWVRSVISGVAGLEPQARMRLVRGSHIILPRLYDHEKAYFFQGTDGRIIFAIPYERDFTLIGTTDVAHDHPDTPPVCTDEEAGYLIAFANQYFARERALEDIVWRYSGVRPLYDDGAASESAATREYVLTMNDDGAPMLNVYGGKITTHRKLAEAALAKLGLAGEWTKSAPLAGGDFDPKERAVRLSEFATFHPKLPAAYAERIFNTHGLEAWSIYGSNWGENFGHGLWECELRHFLAEEFAETAEDILWRRTKLGLIMDPDGAARIDAWLVREKAKLAVA